MLVIRNLRRMTLPQHKDELPHCSEIAATINKPELLFLIALFHDIGQPRYAEICHQSWHGQKGH